MYKSKSLISVVIPTYNRSHFLNRSIKSVLDQTYNNFELIIVDDCSDDPTHEVVRSFTDDRIVYGKHDRYKGGPVARNTGIRLAQGEYIALLDDDDEWLPTKLEKQIQCFAEAPSEVGVVYSGFEEREDEGILSQRMIPQYRGDLRTHLLTRNMLGGASVPMIRKKCFDKVGLFDESLSSCQDWDIWLRISKHFSFDFVPEILTIIHFHHRQISSDFSAMIPGRAMMIEKHIEDFRKHPEILIIHYKRMGKLHFINGTWSQGVKWFRKAIRLRNFEIIKIVAWCILELPRIKWFERSRHFKKYAFSAQE